jgi:hypothetical protein
MDMPLQPGFGGRSKIGPNIARIVVRQIKDKEVCFLLDVADHD